MGNFCMTSISKVLLFSQFCVQSHGALWAPHPPDPHPPAPPHFTLWFWCMTLSFRNVQISIFRYQKERKIRGGTQLWVTLYVPPKRPYFFHWLSPKDPHFYQLSPDDPLFLTNSLSPKDPDTSLSLKDPSFSHLIVKQVSNFRKKIGFFQKISTNLTKCWEIFGYFGPESPYFLMHFTERPPIFVHFVTQRLYLFWRNLSPKDPYIWGHLRSQALICEIFLVWNLIIYWFWRNFVTTPPYWWSSLWSVVY